MDLLQDPLDYEDFDPVAYINEKFPTEESLDGLDLFVEDINRQIGDLDDDISRVIQTQALQGHQATKEIFEAQQLIESLFNKIYDIKVKASESENMVQELCADIKKLDCAKTHLQMSITSLNRLQMLMNAVGQLELLAGEMQFRESANLLDAVKQFMTHFEKYKHITAIAELINRVDNIRSFLTRKIRAMFVELSQNIDTTADVELALPNIPGGLRAISDACLVIDALGYNMKRDILDDFVKRQLNPYEAIFGPGRQHYSLDQIERRWAWFKRLLRYIDDKFSSIFPSHWRIELRLSLEFVDRTKLHLISLLTEFEHSDRTDVNTLLKALQSSLRFEKELSDKFQLQSAIKKALKDQEQSPNNISNGVASKYRGGHGGGMDDTGDEEEQLKKDNKIMYIPTDHGAMNNQDETDSGFLTLANSAISGGISGIFDKFLGSYVMLERKNLEEMLLKLSSEEDTTNSSSELGANDLTSSSSQSLSNVYASSTSMFVFIKNSIKRCTGLTTGQTFLDLTEEFKTSIRQYISILRSRCPPEIAPGVHRLPPNGEVILSYLINTGEYCADVLPQLEQMIQQKIQPNLSGKVDFAKEIDGFMDFVAYCLRVLVSGIMDRLEPSFKVMQSTNWGTFEDVGEESKYLHACNTILLDLIPNIRISISSSYFQNYCTKLSSEILQRFLDAILKQKKISELATQQLLLDTYSMKTLMLHLPNLTSDGTNKISTSNMYTKLINAKATHIEVILKLVGTPDDMLLDRFKIMWPEGQSSDLQMIMSLKGTKRTDQQALLEILGLSNMAASKDASSGGTNSSSGTSDGTSSGINHATKRMSAIFTTPVVSISSPGSNANAAINSAISTTASYTAASLSSMKNLTQDLSSQARNAVGNLKWATTNK